MVRTSRLVLVLLTVCRSKRTPFVQSLRPNMLATEGPIACRTILQMFTAVGHEAREDEGPGSTEAHPYTPFLFTVSLPSVLHSRERGRNGRKWVRCHFTLMENLPIQSMPVWWHTHKIKASKSSAKFPKSTPCSEQILSFNVVGVDGELNSFLVLSLCLFLAISAR